MSEPPQTKDEWILWAESRIRELEEEVVRQTGLLLEAHERNEKAEADLVEERRESAHKEEHLDLVRETRDGFQADRIHLEKELGACERLKVKAEAEATAMRKAGEELLDERDDIMRGQTETINALEARVAELEAIICGVVSGELPYAALEAEDVDIDERITLKGGGRESGVRR